MSLKVFIADDNDDFVLFFKQAINHINSEYRSLSVENGQEAISILTFMLPSVPDFIFIDVKMPIMNGHEIVKQLKNIPLLKDVPVIMYSAVEHSEDRGLAKEAGVVEFFVKPTNFESLVQLLRNIILTRRVD